MFVLLRVKMGTNFIKHDLVIFITIKSTSL